MMDDNLDIANPIWLNGSHKFIFFRKARDAQINLQSLCGARSRAHMVIIVMQC